MEQDNNKFPHNLKVGDKVMYTGSSWFGQYEVITIESETKTRFRLSNGKEVDKGKTWTRCGDKWSRGYISELTPEKEEQIKESNLRSKYRNKLYEMADEIKGIANNRKYTSLVLKQILDKLEEVKQILE